MRKHLLTILLILFFTDLATSQFIWFAKGQVFSYYVRTGMDPDNYGIHTITVGNDTIIEGQQMKILDYLSKNGHHSTKIVFQVGDKIYEYNIFTEARELVFDFSSEVGDYTSLNWYKIKSIGKMHIAGGKEVRTQVWGGSNSDYDVLVIEGIGMVGDPELTNSSICSPFIPNWGCNGVVDGYDYFFRCFTDENFTFDPYNKCLNHATSENQVSSNLILPNPNQGSFSIERKEDFNCITIFDITGRKVGDAKPNEGRYEVSQQLPDGLYFLTGHQNNEVIFIGKMVIINGQR